MAQAKIAPAEWAVMEVLWGKNPLSAAEVIDALQDESEWHPKTIRTLLERLVQKGALSREKRAGCFRYAPLVEREDCLREEGRSFLNRFFGGQLAPMVASFLDDAEVSRKEIEQLRALLDKRERGNRK